jgi:hypothetical protein
MKTRSCVASGVLALLLTLVVAGLAQATFTYDFDHNGITAGSLAGQGVVAGESAGWTKLHAVYQDGIVVNGPAGSVNTSLCVTNGVRETVAGGIIDMPTITYTSTDTAVEQSFWAYVSSTEAADYALGGVTYQGGTAPYAFEFFGIGYGKTYIRGDDGVEHDGDTLAVKHWYEMKLTTDYSVAGGSATLRYRDVTAGATTFTTDAKLAGIALGLPTVGGNYVVNGQHCYVECRYLESPSYVDNLFPSMLTPVPEPGAITLLAGGLVSMLAYAWRKRK